MPEPGALSLSIATSADGATTVQSAQQVAGSHRRKCEHHVKDIISSTLADQVVDQLLGLRPGETLCILRDLDRSQDMAEALAVAALGVGAESVEVTVPPRTDDDTELPSIVAPLFLRSSALVNLSSWSLVHNRAGTAALAAGARLCNLRGFDDRMLDSPGVSTDYRVVRDNALAVDAILERAREVHITTPGGTDLRMRLCGRKGRAQTGFATEPGHFASLPDGEATVAPLEGSTYGRIVDPYIIDGIGLVDEPFRMEIRDGNIVDVQGGKQALELRDLLEKSEPALKCIASQLALGMNPDCRIVPDTREVSKRLGTIHVAMGDNVTLGGTVRCNRHLDVVILDATVALDGVVRLSDGALRL
jgi:2,5-dihydroxypyridine 5,6-dioxygenase